MSTIVLRSVKGVPLTNAEVDANFSNLNTDKLEASTTATLTNKTINLTNNTLVASSAQLAAAVSDGTGSGALVFANSPTFVTPALGTPASGVVTNLTGTASININGTVGATTATTGAFTTLTTSSTVTLNGGTANGVAFLNGSKVLTTGSALTFDGTNFSVDVSGNPIIKLKTSGAGNNPLYRIQADANYWDMIGVFSDANDTFRIRYNNTDYYQIDNAGVSAWSVGASEQMRIDSSGNLLVGTTSGTSSTIQQNANSALDAFRVVNNAATATNQYGITARLVGDPNNATNYFFQGTGNTTERATIRSNGGIANYSANDVNLSDRREKTNFAPAKSYLDTICAIPVQTFNYIDQNMEEDPGLTLGVVAQDVQSVAPELVMESNWGTKDAPRMRLSIYQTDLQYALMKALQELKAEFDAYKSTHP
jgi:hypothetical protein